MNSSDMVRGGPSPQGSWYRAFHPRPTQVLTNATLGAIGDEQLLDGLGDEESKRFMHHYNFPPYSVGEVRPIRGPGRREIGHGSLAERALCPVIPDEVNSLIPSDWFLRSWNPTALLLRQACAVPHLL